jgi:hypothetical protein
MLSCAVKHLASLLHAFHFGNVHANSVFEYVCVCCLFSKPSAADTHFLSTDSGPNRSAFEWCAPPPAWQSEPSLARYSATLLCVDASPPAAAPADSIVLLIGGASEDTPVHSTVLIMRVSWAAPLPPPKVRVVKHEGQ